MKTGYKSWREAQFKVCNKCQQNKPVDAFYKNKGTKDGKTTICKVCQNSGRSNKYSDNYFSKLW